MGTGVFGHRQIAGAGRTVDQVARRSTELVHGAVPAPMLATLGTAPVTGDHLATEFKWDGQRAMVIIAGGTTQVSSRNGADASSLGVMVSP